MIRFHGALSLILMLACSPATFAAAVREVKLDQSYLASGEKTAGVVSLDLTTPAPAGAILRLTEYRQADLGDKIGESSRVLFEKPLTDAAAIPFELDSRSILVGQIRLCAEIVAPGQAAPLSIAWASPLAIGIRKRVSLAGDWQVSKVESYEYKSPHRPKNWTAPDLKSVKLPGPLFDDPWLKGWVTLKRDVTLAKAGENLRARFLRLSNINDSAAVTINGTALPETRPIEEMAVLTHWVEFHSQFKGEENAKTRMLFLDLLPLGPVKLALPVPLPETGTAAIEMRIRATSGSFKPRPTPGILGDMHLDLTGPVYVKNISFDTDKPAENRRFKFALTIVNETGKEFRGTLRGVYGRYDGKIAYTGNCPTYDCADQVLVLQPGENKLEVLREEKPRFDTGRATFLILADAQTVLDGDAINFHTVTFEIRDRRDFYLNNERFILKAQGSSGDAPHKRFQLRVMGGNGFRGPTDPNQINLYQSEGLLTSAGGALLASCEKCTFFDAKDTSNIDKAVRMYTTALSDSPGVIMWEATNELHGEPEEARIAMLQAFHKLDPYHRPVLATKSAAEWEAEASDGRVKGVDIVGCQYLLSKEGVDSITAAVTEQPIMSTEVNWNDQSFARDGLWQYWLNKGVAGSLLFDYSGHALDQPTPTIPPPDNDKVGMLIKKGNRDMYQDLVTSAAQLEDGRVSVRFGNQMPYSLKGISTTVREFGKITLPDLAPGATATITLPKEAAPPPREPVVLRVEYTTHAGLPHIAILTPAVTPLPVVKGGAK